MAAQPVLTRRGRASVVDLTDDIDELDVATTAPPDETTTHDPTPANGTWVNGVGRSFVIFAVSRVAVVLGLLPALMGHDPGWGPWPHFRGGTYVARALGRWDGAWYLWVARWGYPDTATLSKHLSDVAFFPGYPIAVRGVSAATGWTQLTSALVIATVLGAVATSLVWLLANKFADRKVADRAAALFAFFPGAFVLSMAYAEALMLVAIAAALIFVIRRQWVLAGIAGLVATMTRPNALAIVAALAVVALVEIWRRRNWWSLAAPAIASLGIVGYFSYLLVHAGSFTVWFKSERDMWHDHISVGPPIYHRLVGMFQNPPINLDDGRLNDLFANIGIVLIVIGLVYLFRSKLPLVIKVYTAFALIIPATSAAVTPRPRMLLAAFPLAIVASMELSTRWYRVALAFSAIGLVVMTYLTASTLAVTP
jgi:hypothetical protein